MNDRDPNVQILHIHFHTSSHKQSETQQEKEKQQQHVLYITTINAVATSENLEIYSVFMVIAVFAMTSINYNSSKVIFYNFAL